MRRRLSPRLLRSAAAGAFAALWMAACLEQPVISADDWSESLDRPQLDELDAPALVDRMAAVAGKLSGEEAARTGFHDPERRQWDFWPSRYPGLRMDQASGASRSLADELLRLGLSEAGYRKLKLIQAIEPLNPYRSPYYSALVFGTPGDADHWGWRFQGHHMSFNFTVAGSQPIVGTPLFLGTQPLSSASTADGEAPLAKEEALARRLYGSLGSAPREQATIDRPPYTYLPERTAKARPYEPIGAPASAMSQPNRALLDELIRTYVENLAPAIAAERLEAIEADSDRLRFAWAGSDQPGRNHYYRIQGGDLLIEYDSRDGGSHIHCVLRSIGGDFGENPLRAHYAAARHSQASGW